METIEFDAGRRMLVKNGNAKPRVKTDGRATDFARCNVNGRTDPTLMRNSGLKDPAPRHRTPSITQYEDISRHTNNAYGSCDVRTHTLQFEHSAASSIYWKDIG